MEYQPHREKTFDYGNLRHYGQAKCGYGVKEPVFSVYQFGTTFLKNTKPVPLCGDIKPEPVQTFYGDTPYSYNVYNPKSEFDKMLRQKK